jgi:hypothetical protein
MAISEHLIQRLELEVKTRNAVHAKINQATNALKVAFEPLIGCKVQLANLTLSKKYKALADQVLRDCGLFFIPGGQSFATSYNEGFRFHLDSGKYRLTVEIDMVYSVRNSDAWHYVKGMGTIGLVRDQILTEVQSSSLKTDYTTSTLLDHIVNLEALSQQVRKEKAEVIEFEEFTRHIYF